MPWWLNKYPGIAGNTVTVYVLGQERDIRDEEVIGTWGKTR
jgi:hypothetical protein